MSIDLFHKCDVCSARKLKDAEHCLCGKCLDEMRKEEYDNGYKDGKDEATNQ